MLPVYIKAHSVGYLLDLERDDASLPFFGPITQAILPSPFLFLMQQLRFPFLLV